MSRLLRLNLTHVVLLGIFFYVAAHTTIDTDTWWHLSAGRWMVQHRQLLNIDVFSHTRYGAAWHFPGWIIEIGMYLIYRIAGLGGLNIWTGIIIAAAFWLTSRTLPEGYDMLRAVAIFGGAAAGMVHAVARPALVTLLLMAVFLWVLENYRRRRTDHWLWLLPPLMVLWVNSHPMFILGFVLVGMYAASEAWETVARKQSMRAGLQRYTLLLTAMLIAVAFNPYGFEMLFYPAQAVAAQRESMRYILEWQSPDFHQIEFLPFAVLLIAAIVVRRSEKIAKVGMILLGGFALAALYSLRNIALFGLAAPVALLSGYETKVALVTKPVRSGILAAVLFLYLAIGGLFVSRQFSAETNLRALEEEQFIPPAGAVAYLKARQPAGPIFNAYNWGGYLTWALPEYPVFVDGRADLYGDAIIRDRWYRVVLAQDGWAQALEGINLVLIEPGWPVVNILPSMGWTMLYEDEYAVIFARKK